MDEALDYYTLLFAICCLHLTNLQCVALLRTPRFLSLSCVLASLVIEAR